MDNWVNIDIQQSINIILFQNNVVNQLYLSSLV